MQALVGCKPDMARLKLNCSTAIGEIPRTICLHHASPISKDTVWLNQLKKSHKRRRDTIEFYVGGLDQCDPFLPLALVATPPLGR